MSKNAEFTVTRAFSIAKIKKANIPVADDEMDDGISTYNNLISQLQIDGVVFGATLVNSKEDDTEVPYWAQEMVECQVAIRLADEFDRPVSSVLAVRASRALRAVKRMVSNQRSSALPNTLPTGSGNYDSNYYPRFFPDRDCGDISSANGDFLLDDEGQVVQNEESCPSSSSASIGDSNG